MARKNYSAAQKKSWYAGFLAGLHRNKKTKKASKRPTKKKKPVYDYSERPTKKKKPIFDYSELLEEARDQISERDAIYGKGGRFWS